MATRLMGWLACVGAVALLIVAMVTGTAAAAAGGDAARISGASVRLPIVAGRPGAGYFTLTAGARPVEVTAVTSPLARVEMHAMSMAGGVMQMKRLDRVRALPGHPVVFAPGGAHLMLFGIARSATPGSALPLAFTLADGSVLHVDALVEGKGSKRSGMAGMAM